MLRRFINWILSHLSPISLEKLGTLSDNWKEAHEIEGGKYGSRF